MKKIGKKLSYYTKILLVLSLLFSNLLPLRTVFAYEGDEADTYVGEGINDGNELEENDEEDDKKLEDEEDDKKLEDEEDDKKLEDEEDDKKLEDEEDDNDDDDDEEDVIVHDYTKELNDSAAALKLNNTYLFADRETERVLYVIDGANDTEIGNIINGAFTGVTYEVVEDSVILTDGENQISYRMVIYNEEYLKSLIQAIVNNDTTSLKDGDIDGDGNIDLEDVVLLKQALKNGFVNMTITAENVTIPSKFDGDTTNILVGSQFTVKYVLTLSEYAVDGLTGLLNYNKDMLRLDNFEIKNFLQGNNKNGKFIYFGDSLTGTPRVTTDENDEETTVYDPKDYVVIEMTFTALESGNDTLSISNLSYFNENTYYQGNADAELDITIISGNNTLSSLSVAGTEIELSGDVTEYNITVGNDVTEVNLEYTLSDLTATVSSIVAPEELAIGENTIIIVVVAENGEEKTYTVVVTREDVVKENETTQVSAVNYSNDSYTDNTINEGNNNETTKNDNNNNKEDNKKQVTKDESKLSRIVIIVLILGAIGGLIYLIFKDDDDETKAANKEVNKLKKEDLNEESPKKVNTSKKEEDIKKTKKKER